MYNKLDLLEHRYLLLLEDCKRLEEEIRREKENSCNHQWLFLGSVHVHNGEGFNEYRCPICGETKYEEITK